MQWKLLLTSLIKFFFNLGLKNLWILFSCGVSIFGKFVEFCYYFWLKFQWSFMSRFKSFETSKNPYLGVLKLCESLWNFVKLCYWNFNKFRWNFMLCQNIWNFRTLESYIPMVNITGLLFNLLIWIRFLLACWIFSAKVFAFGGIRKL